MNHIYRKVWNRARGLWVVASELAHSSGSGASGGQTQGPRLSRRSVPMAAIITAVNLVAGLCLTASAATYTPATAGACVTGSGVLIGQATPGGTAGPAVGDAGTYSSLAGCGADASGASAATIFGSLSQVTGEGGTALGFFNTAAKWSVASGLEASATGTASIAVGFGSQALSSNSIAIGSAGGDDTNPLSPANSTLAKADGAIAIGSNAEGGAQATGVDSIAIGGQSNGAAFRSIAIGGQSTSLAVGAVAIGDSATAVNAGGIAIGLRAQSVLGSYGVAIGADTTSGMNAVAIGKTAASGNEAVSLGANAVSGNRGVAIGSAAVAGPAGSQNVAIGAGAVASDRLAVALGAGSVTAAAVGTTGATIAGTTYAFVGTAPTSAVSIGTAGAERTITNVAAGRLTGSSTDAVNGSQLFATNSAIDSLSTTIATNKTRYYSVNSTGGGNENDDGATGADAIAAGKDAVASADKGVALGAASVSDRAVASATGTIPAGSSTITYNTSDKTLLGAVSVGNATSYRQLTNVADGTQAQDAVTIRQLAGAMQSVTATDTRYFHANSTAADSLAVGAESVAIGPQTVVNGENGIGIGRGAVVQQTAPGGVAIGQNAVSTSADSVALGTNASAGGAQGVAIGAGTQVSQAGGVALGSGSVADRAAGQAGYVPPSATTEQTAAINATTSTQAAVSVGNTTTGQYRQITGVAAGSQDSDAANIAQLRGVRSVVTEVNATTVHYDTNADGTTNYNSVTLGGGNASGSVTIHNVAGGTADTDAVNVRQLNQQIGEAKDWSKSYTDARFNTVSSDLNRIGNRANAGIASAMAMASLPQAYQPNQSAATIALGSFHGETGVAVGMSTISESGRYLLKVNATTNSRGDAGVGVGAGLVW